MLVVSVPWVIKTVHRPVQGCLDIVHSAGRIQEHFMYRNFHSRVALVQEGGRSCPTVAIAA